MWEKTLAEAVKNIQFKSCTTPKNTHSWGKKLQATWKILLMWRVLTPQLNSRSKQRRPVQKISADAHMQQLWLDTEQCQEKKASSKRENVQCNKAWWASLPHRALTFRELFLHNSTAINTKQFLQSFSSVGWDIDLAKRCLVEHLKCTTCKLLSSWAVELLRFNMRQLDWAVSCPSTDWAQS